jgi:hypothetical protein
MIAEIIKCSRPWMWYETDYIGSTFNVEIWQGCFRITNIGRMLNFVIYPDDVKIKLINS